MRDRTRVILLTFEFIRSTSLEKRLLVSHQEFFAGFTFFADRVADHRVMEMRIKYLTGYYGIKKESQIYFVELDSG